MNKKKLNVTNMMGSDAALSRSEMMKIMAGSGSGEGSCILCTSGSMMCMPYSPIELGPSCSWGTCPNCPS